MKQCVSCNRFFDIDDFMDSNITDSDVCPDCYYSGDMNIDETDDESVDNYDDERDNEDEKRYLDEIEKYADISDDEFQDDEADLEERFEIEEGDYEK